MEDKQIPKYLQNIAEKNEKIGQLVVEIESIKKQSEIDRVEKDKALEVKNKWYEKYKQVKRNYEVAKKQAAYFQRKAIVLPSEIKARIRYLFRLIIYGN